jgi:hypothetical protein
MAGEGMILRVQDAEGRGPWKPGMSSKWIDMDRSESTLFPPIHDEVEDFYADVARWHRRGYHVGCAVDGIEMLKQWFNAKEMTTLRSMGYHVYDFSKADKVVTTPTQVVIASRVAFRKYPKVTFDLDEAYGVGGSIWTDG